MKCALLSQCKGLLSNSALFPITYSQCLLDFNEMDLFKKYLHLPFLDI